jgi:hypothetical protein
LCEPFWRVTLQPILSSAARTTLARVDDHSAIA